MITLVDDRGCCWQRGFLLLLLGVLFRSIFVTSFCHIMPLFWRGGCRCHLLHFHCIERALGAISIAVLVVTFMTAGLYTVLYFPCTSTKYRYLIIQYSVPLFPVPTRFVMIFSSLWHDLWINESVTDSICIWKMAFWIFRKWQKDEKPTHEHIAWTHARMQQNQPNVYILSVSPRPPFRMHNTVH